MLRMSLTVFVLIMGGHSALGLERLDINKAQLQAEVELTRLEDESAKVTKKRLEEELRGLEMPAPIQVPATQTARATNSDFSDQ